MGGSGVTGDAANGPAQKWAGLFIGPNRSYSADHSPRRGEGCAEHGVPCDLTGPWLLYDDQADPYQQDNLINNPQAAQIQKQLDEVLTRKLKAAHDEFLPGEQLIAKWGWKVDKNGTAPYAN